MSDTPRMDPKSTPSRPPGAERAGMDEPTMPPEAAAGWEPRRDAPRPDPGTGEVPAGPGDAGLQHRPEVNAGSPGTEQMSNRRLRIGLGIAALLAVLVLIFSAMF